jgi:2',3'-cyclic-nucleotide 2'-phosphodiesterase (5'-nucleotidase family)
MHKNLISIPSFLLLMSLIGCSFPAQEEISATSIAGVTAVAQLPVNPETAGGLSGNPSGESSKRVITVIYTNDEHGWMEGIEEGSGAANMISVWQDKLNYTPGGPFLVLSGGDMWTGPAISTWFHGESMVEVMNAMGYDAAAVGNHEFDFGLNALKKRVSEMRFPLLSANMHYKKNGSYPEDLGIRPYIITTVSGVPVGIIGLTSTKTPQVTNPVNVADFEFRDYAETLRQVVPEVKAAGAELVLVAAHICRDEVTALAKQMGGLGIDMIGAGHCNEWFADAVNNIVVLGGGYHMSSYAYAQFTIESITKTVVERKSGSGVNKRGAANHEITAIVSKWKARADEQVNVVIGYTASGITKRSPEMQALITGAWLAEYPADIAMTNLGGMRADIKPGKITIGDMIGVMPFSNVIVEVELSGEALVKALASKRDSTAISGMAYINGVWVLTKIGEILSPNEIYTILVNDFMYAGGDNYSFAKYNPRGYNTAIDWRQPVIDWIIAQDSSESAPIDTAINKLME